MAVATPEHLPAAGSDHAAPAFIVLTPMLEPAALAQLLQPRVVSQVLVALWNVFLLLPLLCVLLSIAWQRS